MVSDFYPACLLPDVKAPRRVEFVSNTSDSSDSSEETPVVREAAVIIGRTHLFDNAEYFFFGELIDRFFSFGFNCSNHNSCCFLFDSTNIIFLFEFPKYFVNIFHEQIIGIPSDWISGFAKALSRPDTG